mmetsp:Transcript_10974/g.17945  ORF Transcript_10974/g.17945 Transcript_10974/m.17945 type:complete len:226 (-) Transcript_10974:5-682(-)
MASYYGQAAPAPNGQHYQNNAQYGPPASGSYSNPQYQSTTSRPSAPSAPPPHFSDPKQAQLWQWFSAVDRDRSGQITVLELQNALMNGNWTPFREDTVRLMIHMFDRDGSGTIGFDEFGALWKYITDWKQCFDGFDRDRSGTIDFRELQTALTSFGYNLSQQFYGLLLRKFDRKGSGHIDFDAFIKLCVQLRSMTNQFQAYDRQRTGVVTVSYEQFLGMVFQILP